MQWRFHLKVNYPDRQDVWDVAIAIKSFGHAWGSVDQLGNYKEAVDPRQLWIMKPVDEKTIRILVRDSISPKYRDGFPNEESFTESIVHMQAFKVKVGFSSKAWIIKVTCMINECEYPLGYLASKFQSNAWFKMHNLLTFDGCFFDSPEGALADCT